VTRFLEEATGRPVTFDIAGPDPRSVTLAPARICSYPVHVLDNEKVNAYADGDSVKITKGMLWFVEADTELAMVLAHELAHNLMGHAGTFRSMFEDKKSREADADYVGLYIMARAGFEIEKAPNFWRRIAAAFPQMIESSSSHPIMPYRFVALRKTTEEIRRMQAEGLPLVPSRVNDLAYREPVSGKPET
jgi:predicted Zn-dependent protease